MLADRSPYLAPDSMLDGGDGELLSDVSSSRESELRKKSYFNYVYL